MLRRNGKAYGERKFEKDTCLWQIVLFTTATNNTTFNTNHLVLVNDLANVSLPAGCQQQDRVRLQTRWSIGKR